MQSKPVENFFKNLPDGICHGQNCIKSKNQQHFKKLFFLYFCNIAALPTEDFFTLKVWKTIFLFSATINMKRTLQEPFVMFLIGAEKRQSAFLGLYSEKIFGGYKAKFLKVWCFFDLMHFLPLPAKESTRGSSWGLGLGVQLRRDQPKVQRQTNK